MFISNSAAWRAVMSFGDQGFKRQSFMLTATTDETQMEERMRKSWCDLLKAMTAVPPKPQHRGKSAALNHGWSCAVLGEDELWRGLMSDQDTWHRPVLSAMPMAGPVGSVAPGPSAFALLSRWHTWSLGCTDGVPLSSGVVEGLATPSPISAAWKQFLCPPLLVVEVLQQ